jgi:hypothetical protein
MSEKEFLKLIQRRIAQTCIGASAIRNQGSAGLLYTMRNYFEHSIVLEVFIKKLSEKSSYNSFLNYHANRLLKELPRKSRNWGIARKGLNLFFRDVVYNKFLSDYYSFPIDFVKFNQFVRFLEVPLDKEVGVRIRKNSSKMAPRWTSIKSLTPEISKSFQLYADQIAGSLKIAKVNLDLIYWRDVKNKLKL